MGNLTNSYATTPVSEFDATKVATYNAALQILDSAINGRVPISTTGGTTTLSGTPGSPQAQNLFLDISGALASPAIIEIPIAAGTGRNRIYIAKNGTTNAHSTTVRKVGGTGVTVTQGATAILLYNDSDIVKLYEVNNSTSQVSLTTLPNSITARVTHSTTQSISNITDTALSFDTERYDTDVIHDTATNNSRLTCKTGGTYLIIAQVGFAANATGIRQVKILLGGTTIIALDLRSSAGAVFQTRVTAATQYPLGVNDYVEAFVYQDSGGSLNTEQTANAVPEFMMYRLGS